MRANMPLENGYLPDAYGKYAAAADAPGGSCRRSMPFDVEDIPEGTRALGVLFLDWDSIPVCGFPWIHWCAVVTPADTEAFGAGGTVAVPDDASRKGLAGMNMAQGFNSAAKKEPARGVGYVGPCPPDKDHRYTLYVAALDAAPQFAEPFWANELVAFARDHAIKTAELTAWSRC